MKIWSFLFLGALCDFLVWALFWVLFWGLFPHFSQLETLQAIRARWRYGASSSLELSVTGRQGSLLTTPGPTIVPSPTNTPMHLNTVYKYTMYIALSNQQHSTAPRIALNAFEYRIRIVCTYSKGNSENKQMQTTPLCTLWHCLYFALHCNWMQLYNIQCIYCFRALLYDKVNSIVGMWQMWWKRYQKVTEKVPDKVNIELHSRGCDRCGEKSTSLFRPSLPLC